MKIISDYLCDICIVTCITILIVLFLVENQNDINIEEQHYEIVAELKESNCASDRIAKWQSDQVHIKKESDTVYEVTSTMTYKIPLIAFYEERTLQSYIYVPEWQQ